MPCVRIRQEVVAQAGAIAIGIATYFSNLYVDLDDFLGGKHGQIIWHILSDLVALEPGNSTKSGEMAEWTKAAVLKTVESNLPGVRIHSFLP